MSYLVIYPKRLTLQKLENDHCPGTLLCDVLQYGLLVEAMQVSIHLKYLEDDQVRFYRIAVAQMEAIAPQYVHKFERCLNDCVFDMHGMQPNFQLRDGLPTWTAHFSDICFLLSGDRFEITYKKNFPDWPFPVQHNT
jgi:hypothetical protein